MPLDPLAGFLCDQNLGRLTRWLRILGFDTISMRSWDKRLISESISQRRTVLTRKRSMSCCAGFVYIQDDQLNDQIHQLQQVFDIKNYAKPFARCSICNTLLEDIPHENIKEIVPEHVYINHEHFQCCNTCKRIYWPGSHIQRVDDILKSMLG